MSILVSSLANMGGIRGEWFRDRHSFVRARTGMLTGLSEESRAREPKSAKAPPMCGRERGRARRPLCCPRGAPCPSNWGKIFKYLYLPLIFICFFNHEMEGDLALLIIFIMLLSGTCMHVFCFKMCVRKVFSDSWYRFYSTTWFFC